MSYFNKSRFICERVLKKVKGNESIYNINRALSYLDDLENSSRQMMALSRKSIGISIDRSSTISTSEVLEISNKVKNIRKH